MNKNQNNYLYIAIAFFIFGIILNIRMYISDQEDSVLILGKKERVESEYDAGSFQKELESRGFLSDAGMLFSLDGKDKREFWQMTFEDADKKCPAFWVSGISVGIT